MDAPCYVVHYASKYCKWCKAESGLWNECARYFSRRGCEILTLAPTVSEMPEPLGRDVAETQVAYIPFPLSESLRFGGTPTTIVLNHDRHVIWLSRGALHADSLRSSSLKLFGDVRQDMVE